MVAWYMIHFRIIFLILFLAARLIELSKLPLQEIPLFQKAYESPDVPKWFKDLLLTHKTDKMNYKNIVSDVSGDLIIKTIEKLDCNSVILPENHVRPDLFAIFFNTFLVGGLKFYSEIDNTVLQNNFDTSDFENWYKKKNLTPYKKSMNWFDISILKLQYYRYTL
jgi:hypothetical protein